MKGWPMYQQIHQLKEKFLNKAQTARKLDIDVRTVNKYWDMSPDEYAAYKQKTKRRKRKLDPYREEILYHLQCHNDYKTSQILDLLWEAHSTNENVKNDIRYSTLRNYVKELREEYNIPTKPVARQYQAVVDPPLGYQAQVDLGFDNLERPDGSYIKLCAMAMVLSHSRHKYAEWFEGHPQTGDFINFHNRAFAFYGGLPEELVYDQDRLLLVDENFGEIVYTREFETYRQRMGFKTFVTRGSDPESKGRIESVVKYIKGNFSHYRIYNRLDEFNKLCLDWLERTGNGRKHSTTKKVPAEVFKLEREHLRPAPETRITKSSTPSITRNVRKDNTIVYLANRYSLPVGTYNPGLKVALEIEGDQIKIVDIETGELITPHTISHEKGKLIQNTNHLRDRSSSIAEMKKKVLTVIGDTEDTHKFITEIEKNFPRYIRDQLSLVIKVSSNYSTEEISRAISYLVENGIFAATSYRSALERLDKLPEKRSTDNCPLPLKYRVETETRELSEYEELIG